MRRYGIKRRVLGTTRELAAAKQAVNRASAVLRARSVTVPGSFGPPANRGFYGSYTLRGRTELKTVDVTAQNQTVPVGGTVILLNSVAQGSDFTNRIGRKIIMKSILMNINIFPLNGASLNNTLGTYTRCSVIYDTQPNSGALPSYTDVFASAEPNAPINLNNRDRFYVLIEMRGQIHSYTTNASSQLATGSPANKYFSKYRKMTKETIFSGTGAGIGNISTGAVYLVISTFLS